MTLDLPNMHDDQTSPQRAESMHYMARCESRNAFVEESRRDHDLIVWRRPLPQCLVSWLNGLEASRLPNLRLLVSAGDLRAALTSEFEFQSLPACAMRDLFTDDIEALAKYFAAISGVDLIDLRLERIEDNACRLFHRDNVRLRLLTTYRGPSTEWVEPEYARIALANAGRFCLPIRRLEDNEVALFKGSLSDPQRGVVHRSPPIEGSGETRLLLCLNERSKVSPEAWRPI